MTTCAVFCVCHAKLILSCRIQLVGAECGVDVQCEEDIHEDPSRRRDSWKNWKQLPNQNAMEMRKQITSKFVFNVIKQSATMGKNFEFTLDLSTSISISLYHFAPKPTHSIFSGRRRMRWTIILSFAGLLELFSFTHCTLRLWIYAAGDAKRFMAGHSGR